MSFENYTDIDNSAILKTDDWEGDKQNIVLKYSVTISARKCEKAFSDFDTEVKKALDLGRVSENIGRKGLYAVDFCNWGRNMWHDPKDEVDAWEEVKREGAINPDDIIVAKAVFKDDPESFMDMHSYHEKVAEITYALNISKMLEKAREGVER